MLDSILNTIKSMLNIEIDSTEFDSDLIVYINKAFAILTDIGAGPEQGFVITNANDVWSDYSDDIVLLSKVKTYIYSKTKLDFDPPLSTTAIDSLKASISELEWRLSK